MFTKHRPRMGAFLNKNNCDKYVFINVLLTLLAWIPLSGVYIGMVQASHLKPCCTPPNLPT